MSDRELVDSWNHANVPGRAVVVTKDDVRASGLAVCVTCGKDLFHHPRDFDALDGQGRPFLVRGCDGRSYKL